MSEENVEIVRRFLEASERAVASYWQDPRSVEKALEENSLAPEMVDALGFLHPDIVWNAGGFGSARGRHELAAIWDDIFEVAQDYRISVRELRESDGGLVFASIDRTITAKGSGIQTTFPVFTVTRVSDGVITEIDEYFDRHQALEAAGLKE